MGRHIQFERRLVKIYAVIACVRIKAIIELKSGNSSGHKNAIIRRSKLNIY